MFPPQFLDEIRARVPLESAIGKRVRLVRRGRESVGLCPFHKEKTPSFTVNEDKGFFHCFGCGAHGDVIGFVMRDEGLSFPEAVERLASDAGLALPARDPRAEAREKARLSLYEVVEAAAAWFEAELKGPRGASARRYLDTRGVDEETRAHFRLGYAPDGRTALRTKLEQGGVTEAMMLDAGLVIAPDDGRAPYDRFRGRVIFPICDRRGRVVAFGGRALGDGQPKYLNSPETPLFSKGTLLYAQHFAAPAARKAGRAIAVEGYMDVIALHQAGIEEAVAPLGTALTEQQLEALWRLAEDPILCFDGDEAGKRAAGRAVERALPRLNAKRSLRFASLPSGQDPDTMVRDRGRQALVEIVDAAIPLSRQLWRMATDGRSLDTSEARSRVHEWLQEQAGQIPDRDLRYRYLNEDFRPWLRALSPKAQKEFPSRPYAAEAKVARGEALGSGRHGDPQSRERTLLQTLLDFPDLLIEQREAVAGFPFKTPRFARIAAALVDWAEAGADPADAGLREHLAQCGFGSVFEELLEIDTYYLNRTPSLDSARVLFEDVSKRQHRWLEERAMQAEAEGAHTDEESWEHLRAKVRRLQEAAEADAEFPDEVATPGTGGP